MINKKWGFVDRKGKEVIEPKFDKIWSINRQGIAIVQLDGKYGIIDTIGHIISPQFDEITFSEPEIKKPGKIKYREAVGLRSPLSLT